MVSGGRNARVMRLGLLKWRREVREESSRDGAAWEKASAKTGIIEKAPASSTDGGRRQRGGCRSRRFAIERVVSRSKGRFSDWPITRRTPDTPSHPSQWLPSLFHLTSSLIFARLGFAFLQNKALQGTFAHLTDIFARSREDRAHRQHCLFAVPGVPTPRVFRAEDKRKFEFKVGGRRAPKWNSGKENDPNDRRFDFEQSENLRAGAHRALRCVTDAGENALSRRPGCYFS